MIFGIRTPVNFTYTPTVFEIMLIDWNKQLFSITVCFASIKAYQLHALNVHVSKILHEMLKVMLGRLFNGHLKLQPGFTNYSGNSFTYLFFLINLQSLAICYDSQAARTPSTFTAPVNTPKVSGLDYQMNCFSVFFPLSEWWPFSKI